MKKKSKGTNDKLRKLSNTMKSYLEGLADSTDILLADQIRYQAAVQQNSKGISAASSSDVGDERHCTQPSQPDNIPIQ